jgi:exodeoxyribonuclease VII large subunit
VVNRIQDVGLGALWLEFEETRRKLAAEGLFDEDIKRPLPMFPRQVGLVTSRTGAAVRDMIRIFSERAPYVKLVLSPSLVQGETAPGSLVGALNLLELWSEIERSEGREGLDLIIIGRGGGSFEDLACFNDEGLVRRIRATGVPVISAVGHEVDFTIIDFASDVRAATPTQAAQIAAPSADELMGEVATLLLEIRGDTEIKIETYRTGVGNLLSRPVYRRPLDRVNNLRQNIDALSARSGRAAWNHLKFLKQHLQSSIGRLESLDPTVILSRGYSLAFNRDSGKLISKTGHVMEGTLVDLRVSDGYIKMRVEEETERP